MRKKMQRELVERYRKLKERYKENEKKHVERMRRKIKREIVEIYKENEKKDIEKISRKIQRFRRQKEREGVGSGLINHSIIQHNGRHIETYPGVSWGRIKHENRDRYIDRYKRQIHRQI